MPNVKELKDQAKAAGIAGYSSMRKAELVKALEEAGAAPADEDTPKGAKGPEGMPTEPEKANLSEGEEEGLKLLKRRGRTTRTASTRAGTPTEADRGGVTAKDLNAKGAFEPAEKAKPKDPPTLTGAIRGSGVGVPTEADRGGVNELERKLAGVK